MRPAGAARRSPSPRTSATPPLAATPSAGILRVSNKPRRASGSSVEFRVPPEQQLQAEPASPQPSVDRLSVSFAADLPDATGAGGSASTGSSPVAVPSQPMATPAAARPSTVPGTGVIMGVSGTARGQRPPPLTINGTDFKSRLAADTSDLGEEDEDYSASLSAIIQRRESSRRHSRRRRPSSPFSPSGVPAVVVGGVPVTTAAGTATPAPAAITPSATPAPVRRRSSVFTTSSADTDASGDTDSQEQIMENLKLHKEVLWGVKQQPWVMRRKLRLVRQAKTYVKRHEGQLQQRRATRDVLARFNLFFLKKWQRSKREFANFLNVLLPWEGRIKEIESHFGSVVASYFTFLRWLCWVNLVITVVTAAFIIAPEVLTADPDADGERKVMLPEERKNATHLSTLWNFEGVLKYSPIFYGYYTDRDNSRGYRMPLAYFLTGLALYVYSFVAILRKMAANSRMSKLSEKEDECVFTWKLFTGWDYMIGNAETAHNKVASTILGFKEALLEEAEKQREKRNWRIITVRILVNVTVVLLLATSAFAVVFAVQRSIDKDANSTLWRQNETTVIFNIINYIFPALFEWIGILERYHPRKTLRLQLARIMFLNLLNLYSLIFSTFSKIHLMTAELDTLRNVTCEASGLVPGVTTPLMCTAVPCTVTLAMTALAFSSPTSPWQEDSTTDTFDSTWPPPLPSNVSFTTSSDIERFFPHFSGLKNPIISGIPELPASPSKTSNVYDQHHTTSASFVIPSVSSSETTFSSEPPFVSISTSGNTNTEYWSTESTPQQYSTDTNSPVETMTVQTATEDLTENDSLDSGLMSDDASVVNFLESTSLPSTAWTEAPTSSGTDEYYMTTTQINHLRSTRKTDENEWTTNNENSFTKNSFSENAYVDETTGRFSDQNMKRSPDGHYSATSTPSPTSTLHDLSTTGRSWDASVAMKESVSSQTLNSHLIVSTITPTSAVETTRKAEQCLQINCSPAKEKFSKNPGCYDHKTKKKLRTLCWETMFGQEMVKMTVMDLAMTIFFTLAVDFFRAVFVRIMNNCWCWDLEKRFPQYGDFKIAENILHLVNNQGMVWMGMFFSPGLGLINLVKLVIMVYLRSWAVLTCNVPHEVVFRASRSNNFYFALLLAMLFFCVLPVGYAVVWLKPSWHCGPFSTNFSPIYSIFTKSLRGYVPKSFHIALDYAASPGIVIPLLLLLSLVIYYLVSLTNSLREANNDLKVQLRRERTEERRRMFQLVERRKRGATGSTDLADKWKKLLPALPASTRDEESTNDPSTGPAKPDNSNTARRKELLTRLLKHALRKSSATSDEESGAASGGGRVGAAAVDAEADADGTDAEQPDSLPEDGVPAKSAATNTKPSGRNSVAQTTDAGRRPRRQPAGPAAVTSPTAQHREREDSVTSGWSDIPEIRISKTESTDCVVDVDIDPDPEPDADPIESNPTGSTDTVVAVDDLAEKQKQRRRKAQAVGRAILIEARRRRNEAGSVSSS